MIAAHTPVDTLLMLPETQIRKMRLAAQEALQAMQAANNADSNIIMDILRWEPEIKPGYHYPKDNIRDPSGGQFYYHSHRHGEHGHFHTYMMERGLPKTLTPRPHQRLDLRDPQYPKQFMHLVAIGMNEGGLPIHLFTTNRWVTQEIIYPAQTVIQQLDNFQINHSWPAWSTNRWISAMLVLFRPQIEALLHERDTILDRWEKEYPNQVIFEKTDLEIASFAEIDFGAQCLAIVKAAETIGIDSIPLEGISE